MFHQVIDSRLLKEKSLSVAQAYSSALNVLTAMMPDQPFDELPTPEQFRYFYQSRYSKTQIVEKQHSAVKFAKDIRPVKSTSTAETFGPGHRYQIDATIADIYLLSEHDRSRIVGRPVVYVVVDVFSRMIVGLYVGFEGPSWVSAMIALAHIATDKVHIASNLVSRSPKNNGQPVVYRLLFWPTKVSLTVPRWKNLPRLLVSGLRMLRPGVEMPKEL